MYQLTPIQIERIQASEGYPVTKEVQFYDWGVTYNVSTGICDDRGHGRSIWDKDYPHESIDAEIEQDEIVKAILAYLESR
jgi:hypothetical protein